MATTINLINASGRTLKAGDPVKLHATKKNSFDYANLGDIVIGTLASQVNRGSYGVVNLLGSSVPTEITQAQINAIIAQIPPVDVTGAVSDYLVANPPSGGVTLSTVKADTDIASAISLKHALQDLSGLVVGNTAITGATKTKVTYDAKGLITSGIDATTADIADSTNKRYVSDTQLSNIHAVGSDNQDLSGLQVTSAKGSANGYAPLDASSKVPIINLPDTILGSVNYHGTFSAAGGINPTVSPLALQGDYFVISVAGTISTVVYAIGDWIIYSGTTWDRVANSDKVSSVNGAQGVVVLNQDNIGDGTTYKQYSNTEKTKLAGISGTNTGDSAGHSGLVATSLTVNAKALSSNIVLTPDDLDDASTTHKFVLAADVVKLSNLSNTNTGDETGARVAVLNHAASVKSVLVDADEITGQDSAATFGLIRFTWTSVKAFLKTYFDTLHNPIRLFTNLAAAVVTSGTTEKVLIQLQIPAARAVSGSTFRAWVVGNSSSTGTLIFKVRCGAGGTITDAIGWTGTTSAAQAANARAGFEVLITVRSATTLYTDGVGYAGAVQLPTVIAVAATSAIIISGVWYINLTVICSVGTFTAQVGSVEEVR